MPSCRPRLANGAAVVVLTLPRCWPWCHVAVYAAVWQLYCRRVPPRSDHEPPASHGGVWWGLVIRSGRVALRRVGSQASAARGDLAAVGGLWNEMRLRRGDRIEPARQPTNKWEHANQWAADGIVRLAFESIGARPLSMHTHPTAAATLIEFSTPSALARLLASCRWAAWFGTVSRCLWKGIFSASTSTGMAHRRR